ncbi:uncharacterized protein LOC113495486 [Trichoplusia ni]|uniref:Uncharacterized protein LOC113495486 n=1 Tax=Trichoplusia ni TaxID=7111 RepID=A0A7E5VP55_TRINI|nr:uncharacterized protein LOC113495486 [Trichoplusia ni]
MGKYFVPAIVVAVCGIICLSEGNPEISMFGKLEPFNVDDFLNPPKMDEKNVTCYIPFIKCLKTLKSKKSICVLQRDKGLVTMASICDVHIQNCVVQTDGNFAFGTISDDDIFYFNGKKHNCLYYFKQTKNLKEASKLYANGWVGDTTTPTSFTDTTTY